MKIVLTIILITHCVIRCTGQEIDSMEYYSKIMKDFSVSNVCSGERLKAFNYLAKKIEVGKTKRKFIEDNFGRHYFYRRGLRYFEYKYPVNAICDDKCEDLDCVEGWSIQFAGIYVLRGKVHSYSDYIDIQ